MAKFYETTPTNDPNYLGLSKEPDRVPANKTMGELFEGIGNLTGSIGRSADKIITDYAGKRVREEIEPIMDKFTANLSPDELTAVAGTGAKGKVRLEQMRATSGRDGLGEDAGAGVSSYAPADAERDNAINSIFPVNDKKTLPPVAQREFSNLERLKMAYYSGNFSKTQYDGQVYAALKRLRTEFPGYENEVDAAQERLTGEKSANALRRDIMSDIQANLSAQIAGMNDEKKFREKYRGLIASGGYDPDNAPMQTILPYVNEQLGQKSLYEAAALRAPVNSTEAESVLSTRLGQISTQSLITMGNKAQGQSTLEDYRKRAMEMNTRGFAPGEHEGIVNQMKMQRDQLAVMMRQVAYLPIKGDPEGRTLVGKVKDGDQRLDTMITAQLKPWDDAIKMVEGKQFSALAISTDSLKYENNVLVQNMRREFPLSKVMTAVTEAFPNSPLVQQAFLTNSDLLPQWTAAIKSGLGNAILGGKSTAPAPAPSKALSQYGELTKEQTNAAAKQTTDQYDVATSPENKNTANAAHVAKTFFKDYKYYDLMNDEGRQKLFIKMAAPSKTEYIKTLAQKDPSLMEDYKNWMLYTAQDIWRRKTDNLQAQMSDPRYDIRFDLKKMAFVDHTAYTNENKWNVSRQAGVEQRATKEKLDAVNNAITYLRPIVGDDPAAILPALGVNPHTLKEDLFGKKIVDAIAGAALTGAKNAKGVVTEGIKDAGEGVSNMQKWNEIFGDRIKPNPR